MLHLAQPFYFNYSDNKWLKRMMLRKVSKPLSSLISSIVFVAHNLVGRLWNSRQSPLMQDIDRTEKLFILTV